MKPTVLRALPLLALAACLTVPRTAHARPSHKKAMADFFGTHLAVKLNACTTCHLPDKPGAAPDDQDKPHNPFGERLKNVRAELKKAEKNSDIPARLLAVADDDSDRDGVPNLLELLTGHNPGDAADKPTDRELTEGRRTIVAFLKAARGYPWTPFEKVKRPPVPEVKNASWVRNPIDRFLSAEHEARGLTPRPEAPRHVLLRRVHLDLTGLPPTPEELQAFLDDKSPDAYEKVVDRLLASPQYGERWGRHWMDVWRYSDWAGYGQQLRDSQLHIWHWRDWIVESLNADKGYDRMVLEMLAADELTPEDPKALRATGFLARNYKLFSREKWLVETVEHTFLAFQATTIGCARCHDHMYDPLPQKEYYQLRAIFEPYQVRLDRLEGEPDTKKNALPRIYDSEPKPTYLYVRGDDRNPDKSRAMTPGVPEAMGGTFGTVAEVKLPKASYDPDRRAFVTRETIAVSEAARKKAGDDLESARKKAAAALGWTVANMPMTAAASLVAVNARVFEPVTQTAFEQQLAEGRHAALLAVLRVEELEEAGKKDTPEWKEAATAAVATQRQAALPEARKALRLATQALDKAAKPMRDAAQKKVEEAQKALAKAEADIKVPETTAYVPRPLPTYPQTSTGRRLAFAKWLTRTDNPLTARVAVNHVWLRHFGQAIVPSVFDFGRNGRPPSHPALMDWLAAEFMEQGWSFKKLHRLILTSAAYRMASTPDESNLARDRDNVGLWRMAPRRVEAEVVRDMVFHVAGRLDLTMGGPEVDHTVGLTTPRRSLYFRHAAEKQMEFLKLFDAASVTECYQRKDSIQPQQALALMNSEVVVVNARLLAAKLSKAGDNEKFTDAAFKRVLSRSPTKEETAECVAFLKEQAAKFPAQPNAKPDPEGKTPSGDPAQRARENLVQVLMNHHEFVTIR